jgi:hypothetical protein
LAVELNPLVAEIEVCSRYGFGFMEPLSVTVPLGSSASCAGSRQRQAFAGAGPSSSGRNAADPNDMLAEGFGCD